jgi:hypothetical protein
MHIHAVFQERLVDERRRASVEAAARARDAGPRQGGPALVRLVLPAMTHGLMRIPAPPRPAEGGC